MNHIRKNVTLTPEQAESVYVVANCLSELAAMQSGSPEKECCRNLLSILSDKIWEVIGENEQFEFEPP